MNEKICWYCSICGCPCYTHNSGSGVRVENEIGTGYCYDCELDLTKRIVKEDKQRICTQPKGNIQMAKNILETYKKVKKGWYE